MLEAEPGVLGLAWMKDALAQRAPEAAREVLGLAQTQDAPEQTVLEAEHLEPEQTGTVPVQSRSLRLRGKRAQRCKRMMRS